MGGCRHVALARWCWICCMAGAIVLPVASARAEGRPSTACRFEAAGTGKVRAIVDGRSFIARRRARNSPRRDRSSAAAPRGRERRAGRGRRGGASGARIDPGRSRRRASPESPRLPIVTAATLAFAYVARDGAQRSVAHEMLARGFARVSARVGDRACADELLAQERPRGTPSLASGANRTMSSSAAENAAELAAETGPLHGGRRQGVVGPRERRHHLCEFRAAVVAGAHGHHLETP